MHPPRPNAYRDHWCGELRASDAHSSVRVAGWVHRRRDHGGLIFIDLRDRSGILQLVFHPDLAPAAHAVAHQLRSEAVVSVAGELVRRDGPNVNPELPTGEIELTVATIELLATSPTPPFPIDEDVGADEALRLRHRALDLRREPMRDALTLRHRVVRTIRETLEPHDFLEIETPILTRATPEGARDFLVPSRLQPGSFYALPQSPQLFKQLLMMGGMERYFQIARCFRDEDQRADRQLEFTQLDVEMSFIAEEDVIAITEEVMHAVFQAGGFELAPPPWPRLTYEQAMARYGSSRPTVRPRAARCRRARARLRVPRVRVGSGGRWSDPCAERGCPRALALRARRSERRGSAFRRRRGRPDPGHRRRGVGGQPREVLHGRARRRGQRRAGRPRRRPAAVRRRP
jgi:aspartyl-tRNA synthetase